jgi:glutaredoxin
VSAQIELTLIGKPGCHLCDDAREAIAEVVTEFLQRHPEVEIVQIEQDISQDEQLAARYREEIPVLLINGKMHNYWRIDAERLTRALFALANA